MLAIPERVPSYSSAPDQLVWHKSVDRVVEEFQPIACSDEGIVFPWPKQEVPLRLDKPNEAWCPDCLALIRTKPTTEQ